MEEPIHEPQNDTFEKLVARAEELTRHFEQHPNSAVREDVFELLQTIDEIHRDAILSLVELMVRSGNHELIHSAAEHAKISALFQLYDVLPLPELVRWQEALDIVRPTLKEHKADVELLRITDGMPYLRLKGAFTIEESTLRQIVQESISAIFGSYQSVKWEPRDRPPVPPRFVPVTQIKPAKRQHWVDLPGAEGMPVNSLRNLAIRKMDVLVCRSDSGWYAFPNACPGSALPLHMGRIANETLYCPWHACAFDVRTGKRKAGSGQDLKPLTLRIEGDKIQLGIWE
jgi:nitrite reductase (NADH) small subunit